MNFSMGMMKFSQCLGAIFNSLSEGVVICDQGENVVFSNQVAEKLLKVELEKIPLKEWPQKLGVYQLNETDIVGHEELPLVRALKGKHLKDQRLYLKSTPGMQGIFLSVDAFPLRDEEDVIIGAVAIYRDISHKVLREREIVEERAFFQKLLDFFPGFVLIKDLNGNILYGNQVFREKFPHKITDGKTVRDLLPPQDSFSVIDELTSKVIQTKTQTESLLELKFNDDSVNYFRTIYFPVFDNSGNINSICILGFNETAKVLRKKSEESERIKSINASKLAALGTLAAEIGHEINNPLSIIKTSVALIKNFLEEQDSREMIEGQVNIIDSTTNRITDIVSALRHVSRDSKNEKLSLTRIGDIFSDIHALCRSKFKMRNIELNLEKVKISSDLSFQCARVQLTQVLLNILMNAGDAALESSRPWVVMKVSEEGDFLYFKIYDSGPGVPEEIQGRLFEPFFTTKDLGSGTGLGLSISKDIMIRQGGDVYLDTKEGPNCFVVKLPKK